MACRTHGNDFTLVHLPGKKNDCTEALSRRPDHDTGEERNFSPRHLHDLQEQMKPILANQMNGQECLMDWDFSPSERWSLQLLKERHKSKNGRTLISLPKPTGSFGTNFILLFPEETIWRGGQSIFTTTPCQPDTQSYDKTGNAIFRSCSFKPLHIESTPKTIKVSFNKIDS